MKIVSLVSFLVLSILFFSCKNKDKQPLKPNILLIMVDDLGYADFEPFSFHADDIPNQNLSRIGEQGRVFTQAYTTAPVCSPSRAGIITGKNQFRWDIPASWGPGLPDSVATLAEYLKKVGYYTIKIGKNDLGRNFHKSTTREYPTRHGFDEFIGFSAHAHDYYLHSKKIEEITPDPAGTSAVLGPLMYNDTYKSYESGYLTDILTDEAILSIEKKQDTSFFMMLSYSAVHHLIHQAPDKYLEQYEAKPIPNYHPDSLLAFGRHQDGSYSAYYDKYSRVGTIDKDQMRRYYLANLHALDDNIGRLLDFIENRGLSESTSIVFVSDNGGSPLTGANNAPLTAGKYSLYEGGIRIPMAMTWPGKIPKGSVEKRYISTLDIFPTIKQLLGDQHSENTMDGRNLLVPEEDRLLVWKWQKSYAARKGKWKVIYSKENHWKSEPTAQYQAPVEKSLGLRLFDIDADPGERIDLATTYPDTLQYMVELYESWMEENRNKY